jgi:hypothetical protein
MGIQFKEHSNLTFDINLTINGTVKSIANVNVTFSADIGNINLNFQVMDKILFEKYQEKDEIKEQVKQIKEIVVEKLFFSDYKFLK